MRPIVYCRSCADPPHTFDDLLDLRPILEADGQPLPIQHPDAADELPHRIVPELPDGAVRGLQRCGDSPHPVVNANLKMSIFAETKCNFSPVSTEVYTALIHQFTCRFEARQALIYQLVLGLTGENGKYNYSRAVHVYPLFFDITCSAKNYKIAPALTSSTSRAVYWHG